MTETHEQAEARAKLQMRHVDARSALARLAQEEVEIARRSASIVAERASWQARLDRVEAEMTALGIEFCPRGTANRPVISPTTE